MTTRNETPGEYIMRKGMDPYEQIDLQAEEIERLQKLYDVAVADRVRMHEEIKRLRAALERLALNGFEYVCKEDAKHISKISREALSDD